MRYRVEVRFDRWLPDLGVWARGQTIVNAAVLIGPGGYATSGTRVTAEAYAQFQEAR